jgi:hypothetical protein
MNAASKCSGPACANSSSIHVSAMPVILPAVTGPRNEDSSDAWSMAHASR